MNRVSILFLVLILGSVPCLGQSDVESSVLQRVQEMMKESGGRVTFSDLHNDPHFNSDQKAFLSRLYEVFFQIPGHLKHEYESLGRIPSRTQIAAGFGISPTSVELLLQVMEADSRVPELFKRSADREINQLNLDNITAFMASRGSEVRITRWEGQPIPKFSLESFSGEKLSSADLKGQSALLYFWFTGCPPCVRIAPILSDLDKEYRARGFQMVGINADRVLEIETSDEQRTSYLKKNGTEYPNLHLDEATRQAFGSINVYPTLFFVRPDGTVAQHLLNFQDRETLEKIIQSLLN